ncbi:hypothetical protein FIBSPDRAFT_897198 [Athelia psychrophila]|uniref:Uncharacterized protein n=1 Tax=Athelia psychrophila TaxID=1759441 RepID=A0A166CKX0_9AGAM|nr:hypothetical protein FIBSPDRAFT_897198 [Fibularhizoctonia sp. CBS 109695]
MEEVVLRRNSCAAVGGLRGSVVWESTRAKRFGVLYVVRILVGTRRSRPRSGGSHRRAPNTARYQNCRPNAAVLPVQLTYSNSSAGPSLKGMTQITLGYQSQVLRYPTPAVWVRSSVGSSWETNVGLAGAPAEGGTQGEPGREKVLAPGRRAGRTRKSRGAVLVSSVAHLTLSVPGTWGYGHVEVLAPAAVDDEGPARTGAVTHVPERVPPALTVSVYTLTGRQALGVFDDCRSSPRASRVLEVARVEAAQVAVAQGARALEVARVVLVAARVGARRRPAGPRRPGVLVVARAVAAAQGREVLPAPALDAALVALQVVAGVAAHAAPRRARVGARGARVQVAGAVGVGRGAHAPAQARRLQRAAPEPPGPARPRLRPRLPQVPRDVRTHIKMTHYNYHLKYGNDTWSLVGHRGLPLCEEGLVVLVSVQLRPAVPDCEPFSGLENTLVCRRHVGGVLAVVPTGEAVTNRRSEPLPARVVPPLYAAAVEVRGEGASARRLAGGGAAKVVRRGAAHLALEARAVGRGRGAAGQAAPHLQAMNKT